MVALNNNGVKAKMLVRDKVSDDITVVELPNKAMQQWKFLWERFKIFVNLRFRRKHLFEVDTASCGTDITSLPEFKEADVIHLEWINQGMLSLADINKILNSGVPVVWTMHDLWPASSICHYAKGCLNFKSGCHNCRPLPGNGSDNDLSARVWQKKNKVYGKSSIQFVTCSRWLETQAKESALLRNQLVVSIPNPIDTLIFKVKDKQAAREHFALPKDMRIILFVSQRVTDERKGMSYFVEAIKKMVSENPNLAENTAIAILGGHSDDIVEDLPLKSYSLGYIGNEKEIVNVYNSADMFVLPSVEDNLPNTIMEAMACGVPCVGFNVGGIPEMIDHKKNGYVANYKDAADLAEGMRWVLDGADIKELSRQAVAKVVSHYSQRAVALRYIDVYNEAMAKKSYRL
jgi:glycosyltransferase involved in cell wall biosynthesis